MNPEFNASKKFVPVGSCDVPTNRGIERIGAFSVAVFPVTIGEFTKFCEDTGYITEAEQNGSAIIFNRDPKLQIIAAETGIPAADQPASVLSYNDALAFSKWGKVDIPSDAEWVAASILDWSTVYPNATKGYRANVSRGRMRHHGYEWTSSLASDTVPTLSAFELGGYKRVDVDMKRCPDDMTVRFGPVYALFEGWKTLAFNMWAPRSFYSTRIGLRVIIRGK